MNTEEYLADVLKNQNLADDSPELKELQRHRADVEELLRKEFPDCSPTIRYGGSKAKGTLNKELYDLDIICYFPNDDDDAGDSLEDIYNNVCRALEKKYRVAKKTSALRLQDKDPKNLGRDFHVDVVPGRYTDDSKADCFIYQASREKRRLKTNLDMHINHVKKSGVVDAIRLQKLWKTRRCLPVKQFVWELLVIDLLKGKSGLSHSEQLEHVWTEIRDAKEPMRVEDPANPGGNDLSSFFDDATWQMLANASRTTLDQIETSGWESVFGTTKRVDSTQRVTILTQAASAASIQTKPWAF